MVLSVLSLLGIAISQTNYKHEVEKKVEPIAYAMFVPVFFVSIGMNITFDGIGNQIWFILALTVIAVLTKLIGCGFGARMTGFDAKSSAIIGPEWFLVVKLHLSSQEQDFLQVYWHKITLQQSLLSLF